MSIIAELLNIFHFIALFSPVLLFFIPRALIRRYRYLFKYYFLIMILVPVHWVFFDGKCIFSMITANAGGLKNTETTAMFSEVYMKWLYKPIMNLIGWKWDSKGLNKMVNLHWVFNFLLLWYFNFYFASGELYC